MTAVIGILNKAAVAIAADSAVTVGGPTGPKIFNRANKIFTISKSQPVGLMIYNHGEFMGTPWETIIKLYRTHLGSNSFARVEDYKNDFLTFLHDNNFFCDTQQQKMMLLMMLIDYLRGLLQQVFNENQLLMQSGVPDLPAQLGRKFEDKVDQILAHPDNPADFNQEFADFEMNEFDAFGFIGIQQAIHTVVGPTGINFDLARLTPKIKDITFRSLKSKHFYNYYSGLVFAGFGTAEIFPRLIAINVSIALNNRLKFVDDEDGKAEISHNIASAIVPFAQKDVINTVLLGTDPGLYDLYMTHFESFISKQNLAMSALIRPVSDDIANRIAAIDSRALTIRLNHLISQERKKRYIDPMMQALVTLSKEDLAEMAESLIYLTYLKRRFSFSIESVGGPVDVAVITKGDGFIWIKRKHYFSPDLNHQFFNNY